MNVTARMISLLRYPARLNMDYRAAVFKVIDRIDSRDRIGERNIKSRVRAATYLGRRK